MEDAVDAGKVKSIGLSNFNSAQIQEVIDAARIKPVNLQVHLLFCLCYCNYHSLCSTGRLFIGQFAILYIYVCWLQLNMKPHVRVDLNNLS